MESTRLVIPENRHSYNPQHLQEVIDVSYLSLKFRLTQWVISKKYCLEDWQNNHKNLILLWTKGNILFQW